MDNLNHEQRTAVEHSGGPLLVQAGPGSGKTTVLAARVHYLLAVKEVRPHQIMAITVTRKAAKELRERVRKFPQITSNESNSLIIGTFHSVFLRILKAAGLRHEILADEVCKERIIKSILKEQGLTEHHSSETLLGELSYLKNYGCTTDILAPVTQMEREWLSVMKAYEDYKQGRGLLDFDDILLETKELLEQDAYLLSGIQRQFEHVLVDEFQDINRIQSIVIKMITAPQNNIFAVGDMQQSIYGFRAASVKYICEFQEHFPEAKEIKLGTNYRSTDKILNLANQVIRHNNYPAKENIAVRKSIKEPVILTPADPEEEAEMITRLIQKEHYENNTPLSHFAVLYRTIEISRPLFEKLTMENIPFHCYNNRIPFYQSDCIKPVMDYLRLAVDPLNLGAMLGLLHTLYISRKNSEDSLRKIYESSPDQPVLEHLLNLPLKDFQKEFIVKRIQLVESLGDFSPVEAVRKIRCEFYDRYLNNSFLYPLTNQKEQLFEKLDELETSAARFNTISKFIKFADQIIEKHQEMRSDPNILKDDKVSLMTIHTAKGLEFKTIFLIGAVEDVLPHKNAVNETNNHCWARFLADMGFVDNPLEEECRLLYVALTRAMDELYISCPKFFKKRPAYPSRFIEMGMAENKLMKGVIQ